MKMVSNVQKKIEAKWQKKWKDNDTFQPKIDNSKEKFFATIAYPYANSVMHIGHGRTSTTCDILARYQRVNGKNVLYPMGFHITGTPVLAVSDGIAKGDEKQIKLTRNAISDYAKTKPEQDKLLDSFKDPMNIAKFFSGKIEETFNSIGLGIDWSRQFTTGDKQYQKFIEWQYKKLKEAGILVQGKYPILYSPADKNAVGEDDVKDGDTDKVTVQEMNYLMFKLVDSNEFLVAATLRPDALFGTTNLWVDENLDLIKVEVEKQIWIVAKKALVKLENQFEKVKILSEHKGKEFINQKVIVPIINREVVIAKAEFIDPNHGTGIVYSSPAGAPQDYMALIDAKKEGRLSKNVEVINTVKTFDKKGNNIKYNGSCPAEDKIKKFGVTKSEDYDKLELAKTELYKEEHFGGKLNDRCGEFSGIPIKIAKNKVLDKLTELKLGGIFYETSRRAKTRGGDEVIVAILEGQWFLDYSKDETKQKAYDVLDNMTYRPNKMRDTQKGYLEWVQMRPCARKRGIGTKLPYDKDWVIEALSDSTIYQMLYTIADKIYGDKVSIESLNFEFFDYVFLGKGDINKISKDVKINVKKLEKMREEVLYWKSFDLRYTASTHMSNHLSFLIYHYGIIFPKELWPKNITIGGLLIKDGEKISKSKGNGIPLFRIKDIYGADLYRLYVGLAANYDVEMDFKDEEIYQLEKKLNRWKFLVEESIMIKPKKYDEYDEIDKWLISKFYSKVENYFNMMNEVRIREAYVHILYEFLNDVSYHERRTSIKKTIQVIRFLVQDYLILMTPVIPHTCEEYNEKLGNKNEISLKKYETKTNRFISKELENIEGIGEELLVKILRNKDNMQIQKLNKVTIIIAEDQKFELFKNIKSLLENTKNVKEIFSELNQKFPSEKKFVVKFVPKCLGSGISYYLNKEEEKEYLIEYSKFLKKEFDCEIEIVSNDELENKVNSIPGEPGIILE